MVQSAVPSGDTSIWYLVIFAPPVLDGTVQVRLIVVCPDAVALKFVGAPGTVAFGSSAVDALATRDAAPGPDKLMALTR